MESWEISALATFLRPFALLVLLVVVVYPIKWLIWKYMKDSPLKRSLFKKIGDD